MQNEETTSTSSNAVESVKNSSEQQDHSDREVSPKLIVGTKKYGRRSRPSPQSGDELLDEFTSDSDNETMDESGKKSSKVQRSVSQSDVHGAKRRRPMYASKLKRCASLPSHKTRIEVKLRQQQLQQELEGNGEKSGFSCLSQNLRDVWDSFETTNKNVINFAQLEIVCEKVGLHKVAAKLAAEEIFEKLSIKKTDGISFSDFMNLLQSDSEVFSSVENVGNTSSGNANSVVEEKTTHTEEDHYHATSSGKLAE